MFYVGDDLDNAVLLLPFQSDVIFFLLTLTGTFGIVLNRSGERWHLSNFILNSNGGRTQGLCFFFCYSYWNVLCLSLLHMELVNPVVLQLRWFASSLSYFYNVINCTHPPMYINMDINFASRFSTCVPGTLSLVPLLS